MVVCLPKQQLSIFNRDKAREPAFKIAFQGSIVPIEANKGKSNFHGNTSFDGLTRL
jgi:hypothetical protein